MTKQLFLTQPYGHSIDELSILRMCEFYHPPVEALKPLKIKRPRVSANLCHDLAQAVLPRDYVSSSLWPYRRNCSQDATAFFNERVCFGRKFAKDARSMPIKFFVNAGVPSK